MPTGHLSLLALSRLILVKDNAAQQTSLGERRRLGRGHNSGVSPWRDLDAASPVRSATSISRTPCSKSAPARVNVLDQLMRCTIKPSLYSFRYAETAERCTR
jgi:hypothetical protein